MRRISITYFFIAGVIILFCACKRVPDYVIPPDEMSHIMADIRIADAVVSVQRGDYPDDASKLALKNAVMERHGISSEEFDTSLIWYGHNIDMYQEVTQQSIEILESRLKEASSLAAGEAAMSISGDSVDIWDKSRIYLITEFSPTNYIAFDYESDRNWEPGDVYTLRSRLLTPAKYAQWNLTALYTDGAIETITSNISLDNPARQEITLITDSTRTATRISGWINIETPERRPVIIDSIGLMRRRTSPVLAGQKKYSQKLILNNSEKNDSISIKTLSE